VVREIPLDDIDKAVVQVEFSTPSPHELELAGVEGRDDGGETQT
jgi:ribosome maturation factor RimP